ncbi:MAG: hypothetical protein PHD21_01530 [Flavobacteriales bacterium]|nr:hypothetical protein [Flavobacteriales bacterium]
MKKHIILIVFLTEILSGVGIYLYAQEQECQRYLLEIEKNSSPEETECTVYVYGVFSEDNTGYTSYIYTTEPAD